MSALVCKIANLPTFVFLGGDCIDHGGELRPHNSLLFAKEASSPIVSSDPIPCARFEQVHPAHATNVPVSCPGPSSSHNDYRARETIRKLQEFDANEREFVVAAHDVTMLVVVDLLPKKAYSWKEQRGRRNIGGGFRTKS